MIFNENENFKYPKEITDILAQRNQNLTDAHIKSAKMIAESLKGKELSISEKRDMMKNELNRISRETKVDYTNDLSNAFESEVNKRLF